MARTAKAKESRLEVKLAKSLIGSKKDQIATAYALGLHKIRKISHLLEVTEAEGGTK